MEQVDIIKSVVIMVIFIAMALKVPSYIHDLILKRLEAKAEMDAKEDPESLHKVRVKNLEYNKKFLYHFKRFFFVFLPLFGITIALYAIDYDIYEEIGLWGYNISILSSLRFLWLILFTIFLSQAVPIWLLIVINNFVIQLKDLGSKEEEKEDGAEEKEESVEEEKKEEGVEEKAPLDETKMKKGPGKEAKKGGPAKKGLVEEEKVDDPGKEDEMTQKEEAEVKKEEASTEDIAGGKILEAVV